MKLDNKYAVLVYSRNGFLCKYSYVKNLYSFSQFLNKDFPTWESMNVYLRKENKFLKQFKNNGSFIPVQVD